MSAQQRRLEVLRAVVEDFVSTNEPVGSRAIVERHHLGVSAATVRNDMAALEEEGYITHPHTSAGRIPTDKGYRLFVDRLSDLKPMSSAERRAIETFIDGAVDLDDVLRRSVRLLAQLTKQAAVISYPSLSRSAVRHIELVQLTPSRLMVVMITDSGRVEQRVVDVRDDLAAEDITTLRDKLGESLAGVRLTEVGDIISGLVDQVESRLKRATGVLSAVLLESLAEPAVDRLVIGGAANLTRNSADFQHSLAEVLEALEEHVVLLRLIEESVNPTGIRVSIGEENSTPGLRSTSVVATAYGEDGNGLGGIGVVGPTRMDYAANMGAVLTVARYVGRLIHTG